MQRYDTKPTKSLKRISLLMFYICIILLLLVTLAVCFNFYWYIILKDYNHSLDDFSTFALTQLDRDYVDELFYKTKEIYEALPEDIRQDPFSDEYKEYFLSLLDDKYHESRKILVDLRESTHVSEVFLGFYDFKHKVIVVVLDGDVKEFFYIPGQYISDQNGSVESWDEIELIMNSETRLALSHTSLMGYNATDYIPYHDKNGNFIGFISTDISILSFREELALFLLMFAPGVLIFFVAISIYLSRSMDKMIIAPIQSLVTAAKKYTQMDKVNLEESTDFFESIEMTNMDEFLELKNTMATMEHNVNSSMQEIRRISGEKERMAAELSLASKIQQSVLPKDFSGLKNLDFFASMFPAKQVSGDFYDFFMVDDDHLVMIIADVSGKGVPAALFMMKGKELLRLSAQKGGSPAEILGYANAELAKDNDTTMFITIWLGILEISTGIITAANAGHEYPFIKDAGEEFKIFDDPHGVVCGALKGLKYQDYTLTIPKGGGIFLYTDGVAEAKNQQDKLFGIERIEKCLNDFQGASAKELVDHMKKGIDEYAGSEEQYDDITMMCLLMK